MLKPLAGKPALNTRELATKLKPFNIGMKPRKHGGRHNTEFYDINNPKKFRVLPEKISGKKYSWSVISEVLEFFGIDEAEFLLPKKIKRSRAKAILSDAED
jgi:hypothetical protein